MLDPQTIKAMVRVPGILPSPERAEESIAYFNLLASIGCVLQGKPPLFLVQKHQYGELGIIKLAQEVSKQHQTAQYEFSEGVLKLSTLPEAQIAERLNRAWAYISEFGQSAAVEAPPAPGETWRTHVGTPLMRAIGRSVRAMTALVKVAALQHPEIAAALPLADVNHQIPGH